jgi:GxxExxY protein
LEKAELQYEQQKRINIYSLDSGKILGTYVPDFVVENKIIIEIKASAFTTRQDVRQQQSYLKASIYEVAYLVNFCTPQLFIKRSIYTNDRKPFIVKIRAS